MAETKETGYSYAGIVLEASESWETVERAEDTQGEKPDRIVNDTEMDYSGDWTVERLIKRNKGYYNNTSAFTKQAGAQAVYQFACCDRIVWKSTGIYPHSDEPQGAADVYLDDQLFCTVKSGERVANGVTFDSGKLPQAPHCLRIVAKEEGGLVEINCLEVYGELATTFFVSGKNGAFIHYTTGFCPEACSDTRSGSLVAACEAEERFELCFAGNSLAFYGETGPDGGQLVLSLDDNAPIQVDCRTAEHQGSTLLFTQNQLSAERRFHVLRGEVKKGRVAIDGFVLADSTCLMTVMNARTDKECEQMHRHETVGSDPAGWCPVTLPGKVPVRKVHLDDGLFADAFNKNIRYLRDCLKKPQWVDGKDQDRIWVDMLVGSNEGRMLGGMGNTLRYIEDAEFHEAVGSILSAIERRQFVNDNGYLMPYESTNFRLSTDVWPGRMRDEEKNYDRAMLTKGMLAAGLAGFDEVYPMLRKFYDWFNAAEEYLPDMLLGGMGIQGSIAGPLVAHSPIGVPADILTNQKYYDMDWWLEYLAEGYPEAVYRYTLNRPHNYLLTSLCALFEIYTATGEKKYLDACLGGWQIYHDYFQIPGGGISICEHFICKPWSYKINDRPNSIYETCGSVFWIDLNHRFLQLWPDKEDYATQVEKSLYNILFSCQSQDGRIRYFNHMNGKKYVEGRYNTCCEIQGTGLFGQLPQYLYMLHDDGISVNLFASSSLPFEVDGRAYTLTTETQFPYAPAVTLRIAAPTGGRMALRVRIPSWLENDMDISIRGEVVMTGTPGSYAVLDREWIDGDTVKFSLPMAFRTEEYLGNQRVEGRKRAAVLYGPLLMAVRGPLSETCFQAEDEPTISLEKTAAELLQSLRPTETPLEFRIEGEDNFLLVPYWNIQEETYTCFPVLQA